MSNAPPAVAARGPNKTLLFLAGDGIGAEIVPQARRVAEWFVAERGLPATLSDELFGIASYRAYGDLMPAASWKRIVSADALIFGATGSPEYATLPPEQLAVDQLLRMRKELDLFANLRPVRTYEGVGRIGRPCDLLIVRELSGGLYFGEPRGIEVRPDGSRRAFNTLVYSTSEVERIARVAFRLARERSNRLCSVDKSNVLEVGVLWRDTVVRVGAEEFPDVELSHMYVDNCALQLGRDPAQFDVIVTENLFGDILSDCAAANAGSLGLVPSASLHDLGDERHAVGLYEPIHGSAPDIAGRNVANPVATILSFALCLRYTFGLAGEAELLERAVAHALARGARTADLLIDAGPALGTDAMGERVIDSLAALSAEHAVGGSPR